MRSRSRLTWSAFSQTVVPRRGPSRPSSLSRQPSPSVIAALRHRSAARLPGARAGLPGVRRLLVLHVEIEFASTACASARAFPT